MDAPATSPGSCSGTVSSAARRAFLLLHYAQGQGSLQGRRVQVRRSGECARGAPTVSCAAMCTPERSWFPRATTCIDIAAVVEQAGLGTAADFLAAAKSDPSLLQGLDPQRRPWKDISFPTPTSSPAIDRRARDRSRHGAPLSAGGAEDRLAGRDPMSTALSPWRRSSKKETAVPDERPLVASVYYNRLDEEHGAGRRPNRRVCGPADGPLSRNDLPVRLAIRFAL